MKRLVFAAVLVACGAVQGTDLSRAPTNKCAENPCELYAPGKSTKVQCSAGRCEIGGRPDFDFFVVVSVPTDGAFGAGYTFVQPSRDLYEPKTPRPGCPKVTCLELPPLFDGTGSFIVSDKASAAAGYPLRSDISLPVRARYMPLSDDDVLARDGGFPLADLLTASRNAPDGTVAYTVPITAGRYRRLSYPQPPYDAWIPPVVADIDVNAGTINDVVTLVTARNPNDPPRTQLLDDASGESRVANVSRDEGLDGFQVWIADSKTGARVSVIKTLRGTTDSVVLSTAGQNAPGATALRNGLDVVLSPPEGWIGVPRLVSSLLGGQGLGGLLYPALPARASVSGVIATRTESGLAGIPGELRFVSQNIVIAGGTVPSPLLHYATAVATDDRGRFATVVPPGTYDVIIEPAEGTGFGKVRRTIDISRTSAPTLEPPKRTRTTGRATLSDGRPLASATVLALPSRTQPEPLVVPRAARTVTSDDGSFSLELDQGRYDVSITPQSGTGFPRVVTLRTVAFEQEDLGVVVIPAPTKVQFTVRAPNQSRDDAVPNAVVRFLAAPASGGPVVEVGTTMTDARGRCEILLAQQPR